MKTMEKSKEKKLAIGNIGTRHSLRSACSLPHGSRPPARGGYGNIPTLATISKTAQAILDARAAHSDCSLADLYDPLTMPPDLRAMHEANDRAALAACGLAPDTPEPEIVAHLFGLYAKAPKETKATKATMGGGRSLRSLPSLSSLEGGSNG